MNMKCISPATQNLIIQTDRMEMSRPNACAKVQPMMEHLQAQTL